MIPFAGTLWRILAKENAHRPLAPEGRFHHTGQTAIYTSLTAQGAGVAIQRYLKVDNRPKVIVPLLVKAAKILDMRRTAEDVLASTMVWQDVRATGAPAPTWMISDAARKSGAQGILYQSRTRPEFSHLMLFGIPDPGSLTPDAAPKDWP